MYRRRATSNDKTLADWTIERFKRYLDECQRGIKRFKWLIKLAEGKTEQNDLDIERAKAYLIGDLIQTKVMNRSSNRQFYCCPLHTEKTPSFVWYKNNNSWYCFGSCGAGGDSIDLYQRLHDVDFIQAVKALI